MTTEPDRWYTLDEAHALTRISVKTLGKRCREGKLPGSEQRIDDPREGRARWMVPESALEFAGLMAEGSPRALAMAPGSAPALPAGIPPLGEWGDRVLTLLESGLATAREAGSVDALRDLLAQERERVRALEGKVRELEAELECERSRPLTAAEMWWGRRRSERHG